MPQRAWSWMNHLNPKISRQLIKCPSTWQAWAHQEKSQSLLFFCLPVPPWEALLSLKGPRGIKASPTGRPDNSTQRVEGVHIGLQEGARVRELWMQQSAPLSGFASLTNMFAEGSNKDSLGQQHCWGSLQLCTLPALSASQWCFALLPRLQEEAGQNPRAGCIYRLNTSLCLFSF